MSDKKSRNKHYELPPKDREQQSDHYNYDLSCSVVALAACFTSVAASLNKISPQVLEQYIAANWVSYLPAARAFVHQYKSAKPVDVAAKIGKLHNLITPTEATQENKDEE